MASSGVSDRAPGQSESNPLPPRRRKLRRWILGCGCGCAVIAALSTTLLIGIVALISFAIPKQYTAVESPLPLPTWDASTIESGWASPYVGHTGSWDGSGGGIFGSSKVPDLEKERQMGLRWTFMPVYWQKMEPEGPVDLDRETPEVWKQLDGFVIAAHERGLHILMQAPVVGGNAGGPPAWAGRREIGKSAPANMEALVDFAGKLVQRYRAGGTLAVAQGWNDGYGVRAWELDNEPESYRTNWSGQAGDYAEFVTKASARMKTLDPTALILTPGMAAAGKHTEWLSATLDAANQVGSPAYRNQGQAYSLGPGTDVVSFHCYEGLDTFFAGEAMPVEKAMHNVRQVFERYESQPSPFAYARKTDYWHTEGNFDFVGILSEDRRAAWRFQFFARAFSAGIRKVVVMDAAPQEQLAIRTFISVLPNPFPMLWAGEEVKTISGKVLAFRHSETAPAHPREVWVVWAEAGTGSAVAELPTQHAEVELIQVNGSRSRAASHEGRIRLELQGDDKMSPAILVIDADSP